MDTWAYFLLGASLSMDALAISVSVGICTPRLRARDALRPALYFGGFQALMPVLGWLLGGTFSAYIAAFDHWVAFGLLALIGVKMIVDAIRKKDAAVSPARLLSHRALLPMAVATSIDALAVGVSLALVNAQIAVGAALIGLTTFAICFAGTIFGKRLGTAFEQKAAIAGGLALAAVGVKILAEHLLTGT
jgi:putative Mn2+ efflux pump MntP